MHYSFAPRPRRALAQDWILMNLISNLLKARNTSALSGINESLWVSFGELVRTSARPTRSARARAFGWHYGSLTVNEVERIMIRNLSSVSTTFYYHRRGAAALSFLRRFVAAPASWK